MGALAKTHMSSSNHVFADHGNAARVICSQLISDLFANTIGIALSGCKEAYLVLPQKAYASLSGSFNEARRKISLAILAAGILGSLGPLAARILALGPCATNSWPQRHLAYKLRRRGALAHKEF